MTDILKQIGNTFTETHSWKHVRKQIRRNTFQFLIYQLKIKGKSFESPIPLKAIVKCQISNKENHQSSLGFGVKTP